MNSCQIPYIFSKENFELEHYLNIKYHIKDRRLLCKFRTCNHIDRELKRGFGMSLKDKTEFGA